MMIYLCVGDMYSGVYDVCDVTLRVHPHRANWKVCLATVGIEPVTFGSNIFAVCTSEQYFVLREMEATSKDTVLDILIDVK
jgi:hypothetical protein